MTDESRTPLFLVKGEASDEEVAALTVVLQALAGSAADPEPSPRSQWAARDRTLRRPLHTGPGAWRSSGLPR